MLIHNKIYFSERCGIKPTPIIGGSEAAPYSIPWQVALVTRVFPNCGGTLISNQHVLTAAHCVHNINGTQTVGFVLVGEHSFLDNFNGSHIDGTRYDTCRVQTHPQWDNETLNNDFAVVTLTQPVEMWARVNYACLPTSELKGDFLAGKNMTASGWGIGANQSRPWNLYTVDLPVVSNTECNLWFSVLFGFPAITDRMLCAGLESENAVGVCFGDSGGKIRNSPDSV